jgi:hypothetical protein
LALLLDVAVNSIAAVIFYSVGLVTRGILNDLGTVSSGSTSIIQALLQLCVTNPILAYAVSSTYNRK